MSKDTDILSKINRGDTDRQYCVTCRRRWSIALILRFAPRRGLNQDATNYTSGNDKYYQRRAHCLAMCTDIKFFQQPFAFAREFPRLLRFPALGVPPPRFRRLFLCRRTEYPGPCTFARDSSEFREGSRTISRRPILRLIHHRNSDEARRTICDEYRLREIYFRLRCEKIDQLINNNKSR